MSSISPVGGSGSSPSIDSSQFSRSNPARQFDKDLTKFLESKGVSSEEQANIKDDLKKSLTETIQSGGRPDPSKFSNSIKSVLDKHGVDGSEFTKSLPQPPSGGPGGPGGPPPGGLPPGSGPGGASGKGGAQGASQTDYLQRLLDQLDESSKKQREEATKKTDSSSAQKTSTDKSIVNRSGGNLDVKV
jgi:hypothetical protein